MGISDEAGTGASVGAGVSVADGIGGGGVLVTSNPARSMRVLRLLAGSLPAANIGENVTIGNVQQAALNSMDKEQRVQTSEKCFPTNYSLCGSLKKRKSIYCP